MGITCFLCSRRSCKTRNQRRELVDEELEGSLHPSHTRKIMQTSAARTNFAGSLHAAQHQYCQNRQLVLLERPLHAHAVLIFDDARTRLPHLGYQPLLYQALQHILRCLFRDAHDRIAAGQLIAAVGQRIQGQRVIIRSQRFFLCQHGKHPNLERIERIRCLGDGNIRFSHDDLLIRPACSTGRHRFCPLAAELRNRRRRSSTRPESSASAAPAQPHDQSVYAMQSREDHPPRSA